MATVLDISSAHFTNTSVAVDSLLDTGPGWNYITSPISANTLTYSFDLAGVPSQGTALSAFNASQQAAVTAILAHVSAITGVNFLAVAAGGQANIQFAYTNLSPVSVAGFCVTNSAFTATSLAETGTVLTYSANAYVYLDNAEFSFANTNPVAGNDGYQTLLHEIGHAMGLGHPFAGPVVLPAAQDNTGNTVMSYTQVGAAKSVFQSYDMMALQWIYGNDGLQGTFGLNSTQGPVLSGLTTGTTGNDILSGSVGADMLTGGLGDDIYIVNNAGDQVLENPNEGTDTVQASLSWILAVNVENLTLTGGATSGTGNAVGNTIVGNAGANTLLGLGGNDTVYGGAGNDSIQGDQNFTALTGNDVILSEDGDDVVFGGPGDDVVALGAGFDVAIGEAGNDAINGEGGNDAIDGGDGNDTLLGWDDQDILFGSIGGDILFGGNGNDIIMGNRGDPLATDDGVDLIFGDGGQDTIHGGSADDGIDAGAGDDVLDGAIGNDNVIGGPGADIMLGSGITPFTSAQFPNGTAGNDQFIYYSTADGGDSIYGFDLRAGNEDKLFLQPMISAFTGVTTNTLAGLQASGHLRLLDTGADVAVQVDADGGGNGFSTLVTLIGVANTTDLTGAHFFL